MIAVVDVFEANLNCEVTTIARTNYSKQVSTLPESASQFISTPGITTVKVTSAFAMKSPSCPDTCKISFEGSRKFAYNGCACGDVKPAKIDRFVALFADPDGYAGSKPRLGLSCAPSYSIRKASVTLNKTASGTLMPSISFPESAKAVRQSTLLDNITAWDILTEFVRTTVEARGPLSREMDGLVDMVISGGLASDKQAALSKLFSLVAAQVANRNLKAAAQTPLIGTTIAKEDRLMVSAVSFWLLESMLVLLCLLAGSLVLLSPQAVIPCDTSTIAGLASVLARSRSAIAQLEGTGQARSKSLAKLLKNTQFRTNTVTTDNGKPVFRIESCNSSKDPGLSSWDANYGSGKKPASPIYTDPEESGRERGRYKPFTVTVTGRVLILLALSALIITLELLYRHSDRNGGLAEISDDESSSTAHYAWRYVPTAVMVGMSLWLGTLSSTIKLLSPYYSLWRGKVPAEKSITENYLTSVAVVSIWRAIRNRKWGVVTAGAASILASSLAVVASGLLFTEPSVTSTALDFQLIDSFNLSRADREAGLRFANFVLASNLSDPV